VFYALVGDERVLATRGATGQCPLCRSQVRAKCGELITWHWAHLGKVGDCDPWSEPETPWHHWWKLRAPDKTWCEVTMGVHRADLKIPGKGVVELQHSTIGGEEIRVREAFYKNMIWILDARTYALPTAVFDMPAERLEPVGDHHWYWRWPRTSFIQATKRVLLDLGDELLNARRIFAPQPGWLRVTIEGRRLPRNKVLRDLGLRPVEEPEAREVVSYIAEWRVEQIERDGSGGGGPRLITRRREFYDRVHLDRWIERRDGDYEAIFKWMGDGSLVPLEPDQDVAR
jgi:competence protein CoiA